LGVHGSKPFLGVKIPIELNLEQAFKGMNTVTVEQADRGWTP